VHPLRGEHARSNRLEGDLTLATLVLSEVLLDKTRIRHGGDHPLPGSRRVSGRTPCAHMGRRSSRAARYRKSPVWDQSALPLPFAAVGARAHAQTSAPRAGAARHDPERRSTDLMRDALFDARTFRLLTVVDKLNRQRPLIESDFVHSGIGQFDTLQRMINAFGVTRIDYG
jgi:hypothetical protein